MVVLEVGVSSGARRGPPASNVMKTPVKIMKRLDRKVTRDVAISSSRISVNAPQQVMVKSWIIESREHRRADLNQLVRRESGQTWVYGRRSSLLPSATQRFVQLYQRQQFVSSVDSCDSQTQIVVLHHRGAHHLLQFVILENLKPFQITNRRLIGCNCSSCATKLVRYVWALILLLTSHTTGQQANNENRGRYLFSYFNQSFSLPSPVAAQV